MVKRRTIYVCCMQPGVLKEVLALYDYEAQFEDELSFTGGDAIHITAEGEWCVTVGCACCSSFMCSDFVCS